MRKKKNNQLEKASLQITQWMGSSQSIIVHTLIFAICFTLILIGFNANSVMLVVTTVVSLEAIYLSLFIQMTVNRQAKSISEVEKDIDEIQEDVESVGKDIDEIQEDVDDSDKFNLLISQIHQQLKDIDKKVNSLTPRP